MSGKELAATRATGPAAAKSNATGTLTIDAGRVQATYRGREYVRHVQVAGRPVTLDGRDAVVLDAIKVAGLWPKLKPFVRPGISVAIRFPDDRTRFAFWLGNADGGGFLTYYVRPQDFDTVLAVACALHLRTDTEGVAVL